MKKLLCLFLAGLMLLSTFSMVACGDTNVETDETQAATEANTEATTLSEDYACELPGDLDFQDEQINVLFAKRPGREDELVSPELGLGALSDSVYERNLAVEEQVGVKLNFIANDSDTVADALGLDVQSGDGAYDLVADGTYKAITPVLEGYYHDLNQTDYVDTSKHYWTQGYNEMVTFTSESKQYLVTGSAAISLFRLMYLDIYNKTLLNELQKEDLYDVIKSGRWTLDYQYELFANTYVDNGDSAVNDADVHGFVTGDTISVDPYLVASGIHMIVKDPDTFELTFNEGEKERLSSLCDKIQKIYNTQDTFVYKGAENDDVGKTMIIQKFTDKKAIMATIQFYSMETNYNDVGALDYGIAPIPKFSTDQPRYYSYVQDQVTGFGISSIVSEKRLPMVSATLESIGYHSYLLVRPAYYETTLSKRYMKDEKSLEILNLIFDSLYFDFSSTCGNITATAIRDQLRPVLSGNANTISSKMNSWKRSLNKGLKSCNEKLTKLGT